MAISNLVFFGDSLTDNGNLFRAIGQPEPPYFEGRFSNGIVHAEILDDLLGVPSVNLAFGGAEALTEPNDPRAAINLGAQVQAYRAALNGGQAPAGTTAALFIGNNDYLGLDVAGGGNPLVTLGGVLGSIDAAVGDLRSAGVSSFLLYTLPAVSVTPLGQSLDPATRAAADAIVEANNAGLGILAAGYALAGLDVTVVDVNRLADEIAADRETFGFAVTATPIYAGDSTDPVPTGIDRIYAADEIAFFDPIHPTTAAHGVIAAFAEATINADAVRSLGDAQDHVLGFFGNDLVLAGAGDDRIFDLAGNDVVLAGLGDDQVTTGFGDDLAAGGSGDDVVDGGFGIDLVVGNAGNDTLRGGAGDDVLIDGDGSDRADGGAGNDLILFAATTRTDDRDALDGGRGSDTLRIELDRALFDAAAFQADLAAFAGSLGGGGSFDFATIGADARGFERVEVAVDGAVLYSAGGPAAFDPALGGLVTRADLWGFV